VPMSSSHSLQRATAIKLSLLRNRVGCLSGLLQNRVGYLFGLVDFLATLSAFRAQVVRDILIIIFNCYIKSSLSTVILDVKVSATVNQQLHALQPIINHRIHQCSLAFPVLNFHACFLFEDGLDEGLNDSEAVVFASVDEAGFLIAIFLLVVEDVFCGVSIDQCDRLLFVGVD